MTPTSFLKADAHQPNTVRSNLPAEKGDATSGESPQEKEGEYPEQDDNTLLSPSFAQVKKFPAKVHDILSNSEYSDLISWMPHGRSWRVLKPTQFTNKVLPVYFSHNNYSSFTRQVNGWGFRRITNGQDHNSYYHVLFLRGLPQLCDRMRRVKRNSSCGRRSSKAQSSSETSQECDEDTPQDGKRKRRGKGTYQTAANAEDGDEVPDFYKMSELFPLPAHPIEEPMGKTPPDNVIECDVNLLNDFNTATPTAVKPKVTVKPEVMVKPEVTAKTDTSRGQESPSNSAGCNNLNKNDATIPNTPLESNTVNALVPQKPSLQQSGPSYVTVPGNMIAHVQANSAGQTFVTLPISAIKTHALLGNASHATFVLPQQAQMQPSQDEMTNGNLAGMGIGGGIQMSGNGDNTTIGFGTGTNFPPDMSFLPSVTVPESNTQQQVHVSSAQQMNFNDSQRLSLQMEMMHSNSPGFMSVVPQSHPQQQIHNKVLFMNDEEKVPSPSLNTNAEQKGKSFMSLTTSQNNNNQTNALISSQQLRAQINQLQQQQNALIHAHSQLMQAISNNNTNAMCPQSSTTEESLIDPPPGLNARSFLQHWDEQQWKGQQLMSIENPVDGELQTPIR